MCPYYRMKLRIKLTHRTKSGLAAQGRTSPLIWDGIAYPCPLLWDLGGPGRLLASRATFAAQLYCSKPKGEGEDPAATAPVRPRSKTVTTVPFSFLKHVILFPVVSLILSELGFSTYIIGPRATGKPINTTRPSPSRTTALLQVLIKLFPSQMEKKKHQNTEY